MVDIQVSSQVSSTQGLLTRRIGPIWTSQLVGYIVYDTGNVGANSIVYKKTTDGGQTWGADIDVDMPGTAAAQSLAVWYDKWTPGNTGTLIHIVRGLNSLTVAVQYRTLNTATDTLGTVRTIVANMSPVGGSSLSMVRARNGNLYVGGYSGNVLLGFYRSTDGGANWTSRAAPVPDAGFTLYDALDLHPGNEADSADVWCIMWLNVTGTLVLKVYDDSANSWSTTTISTGINADQSYSLSSTTRLSDNHVIVIARDGAWNAVHNVKCWDVGGSSTITAKTNVLTNTQYLLGTSVLSDEVNAVLYVAYYRGGTDQFDGKVYYKTSSDGGVTWSGELAYGVSTPSPNTLGGVYTALSVSGALLGRFLVIWYITVVLDYYSNYDNSIAVDVSTLYGVEVLMDSSLSSDLKATLSGRILETLKRSGRSLSLATGVYSAGSTSANQQTVTVT